MRHLSVAVGLERRGEDGCERNVTMLSRWLTRGPYCSHRLQKIRFIVRNVSNNMLNTFTHTLTLTTLCTSQGARAPAHRRTARSTVVQRNSRTRTRDSSLTPRAYDTDVYGHVGIQGTNITHTHVALTRRLQAAVSRGQGPAPAVQARIWPEASALLVAFESSRMRRWACTRATHVQT